MLLLNTSQCMSSVLVHIHQDHSHGQESFLLFNSLVVFRYCSRPSSLRIKSVAVKSTTVVWMRFNNRRSLAPIDISTKARTQTSVTLTSLDVLMRAKDCWCMDETAMSRAEDGTFTFRLHSRYWPGVYFYIFINSKMHKYLCYFFTTNRAIKLLSIRIPISTISVVQTPCGRTLIRQFYNNECS